MSALVVFVEASTLVGNALLMASRVQSAGYSIITPKSVSKLSSSSLITEPQNGLMVHRRKVCSSRPPSQKIVTLYKLIRR